MLSEWAFGQKRKRRRRRRRKKKNQNKQKGFSAFCGKAKKKKKKYMSYVCMKQNTGLFRILKFPMPFGLCAVNEV